MLASTRSVEIQSRVFIVHHYSEIPEYKAMYEVKWRPIPNLAMDLIVPVLLNFVSLKLASKIFLTMIVVLFNIGGHMLGAAVHGSRNWIALTISFFTYNFSFSYGFVNYMFGLGVFFVTLAIWLRFQDAWNWNRILIVSLLVLIAYLSHLSSYVFLGVAAFVMTLRHSIHARGILIRHLLGLLPFALPVVALFFYMHENTAPFEWWHPFILKKLIGLTYPFISHDIYFDLAISLLFIVVLVVCLAMSRDVNAGLLLVGCVFAIGYFISPMSGGVHSAYLDRRFVVPAVVLLILAFKIPASKTIGSLLMIGLLMLSIVRTGAVWKFWRGIDRAMEVEVALQNTIPVGAKVYPIFMGDRTAGATAAYEMNFIHALHYATINRYAFSPTIFSGYEATVLRVKKPYTGYSIILGEKPLADVNWTLFSTNTTMCGLTNCQPNTRLTC